MSDALRLGLLGVLQGATEFLPISSSGHLVVAGAWLGAGSGGAAVDAALHGGTLLALLSAYRGDLLRLARCGLRPSRARAEDRRLLLALLLATIPAAVLGLGARGFLERLYERPLVAAAGFAVTGCVLLVTLFLPHGARRAGEIGIPGALAVGAAQALAILPGVSRSGTTIVCALALGLAPREAARFSFLMAVPVIAGAVVLSLPELGRSADVRLPPLIVGVAAAAAAGIAALRWLRRLLGRWRLAAFSPYVFALAVVVLVAASRGD